MVDHIVEFTPREVLSARRSKARCHDKSHKTATAMKTLACVTPTPSRQAVDLPPRALRVAVAKLSREREVRRRRGFGDRLVAHKAVKDARATKKHNRAALAEE